MARRLLWAVFGIFVLLNVVVYLHGYALTHYNPDITGKTQDPHNLSFWQKTKVILTGVQNPRPLNHNWPEGGYDSVVLQSNKRISCWIINARNPRGTVILFHGFGGEKSSLLGKAAIFRDSGFNTLLVDFMGSGASEGNQTTVGFAEAEEVKTAFDFVRSKGEKHLVLFGTSMGAVAIMRAEAIFDVRPEANIIECPYGTLLKTVNARFRNMGLPAFPMARMLVFWGGLQNGFNGFRLNPDDYAKRMLAPTIHMAGGKDDKVSIDETNEIYANLPAEKKLVVYPDAGHENYLLKYKKEWSAEIGFALQAAVR